MKGGAVVSIRVSPADLMTVVDLVNKAGAFFHGMSLSSAVSLAMSIAYEELRKQGKIPRRDGFAYSEMLEPFTVNKKNTKVKRAFAENQYLNAAAGIHPSLNGAGIPAVPVLLPESAQLTEDEMAILAKQQADLDKRDSLVDSEETG